MSDQVESSSVGREIGSGLLGAAIALGCALPPIVHLVSGPLGPAIGGFVAAGRVRPGARGSVVIGATLGMTLAALLFGALSAVASIASPGELPSWFPLKGGEIAVFGAIVWVYATVLGTVGAFVHGSIGERKKARE